MNSDDAYMLTLFLVGVAILVGIFTLILRSPRRRALVECDSLLARRPCRTWR